MTNRTGISVAMITKNEEAVIRRCLASVSWADEIVVADTGSTDKTAAICRDLGCRVLEPGWHGFGRTKQMCVDQTSCNWVLSVDADEVVTDDLRDAILGLDLDAGNTAGYRIRRRTVYLGRSIRFSGWNRDFPLRLFHKGRGGFTRDSVHEQVLVRGEVGRVDAELLHHSYPDLGTHLRKMELYSDLGAEKLAARGRRCGVVKPVLRGLFKFVNMYLFNLGFLDGREGLVLAVVSAFGVSLKYFRLWERTRRG